MEEKPIHTSFLVIVAAGLIAGLGNSKVFDKKILPGSNRALNFNVSHCARMKKIKQEERAEIFLSNPAANKMNSSGPHFVKTLLCPRLLKIFAKIWEGRLRYRQMKTLNDLKITFGSCTLDKKNFEIR